MKRQLLCVAVFLGIMFCGSASAQQTQVWQIVLPDATVLTEVCEQPHVGDEYISAQNKSYRIIRVTDEAAEAEYLGTVELPSLSWMNEEMVLPVSAISKQIAIYCTHSDESYEPSDGTYSTTGRGSIYQVAETLGDALAAKGIEAIVSDNLHHPHDAGAYRRSRQTAVELLKSMLPDCLIDIHRDGIPDPASYAVTIGGVPASKIRLLVGRGNQNAAVNKEFALMIKAVADRVYPGLIKDIYLGKGTFNQDLLPQSILFECGTYTLEKERVMTSMPLMADVLNRALYGGIVGSAGSVTSDVSVREKDGGGITMGQADPVVEQKKGGLGYGMMFLIVLLAVSVGGIALLSTGSFRQGMRKTGRNLHEMTGGLIGRKPEDGEKPEHS